jgi:tetratricopeptide (TPR) repeat protein
MADDQEYTEVDESSEQSMLREATEALRKGDKKRARDLLTRLLKVNQSNASYWIWLSSMVETTKECMYCLRMALNLDPQNATAKRGLILLGALPPDDSVPPFPVNRPRSWEEKLIVPKETREQKHGWANPAVRVFTVLGVAVLVVGLAVGGWILIPHNAVPVIYFPTLFRLPSRTPRDSLIETATPTFLGPTPLAYFLHATYTPTPRYVLTEHPVINRSAFEAGLRFMAAGDYENAMLMFEQALSSERNAPDILYYIGEVYRAQGDYYSARDTYQEVINLSPGFAPAFLGRARANLALNPEADVSNDLDNAIYLDPTFTEAYIERGAYRILQMPNQAITDLQTAIELSPDSALAYNYLARAQLAVGLDEEALASALHANQIDQTMLPVYLTLGQAYLNTHQPEAAVGVLQTYNLYVLEDVAGLVSLGSAYNALGDYEQALTVLDQAINIDRRNGEAYAQRGFAYISQEKANLAEEDLKLAVTYSPSSFYAQLWLGLAYDISAKPGDAYIQVETNAYPLADTDEKRAQVYYWMATFLTKIGDDLSLQGASNYWYRLIGLPADSMPEEWRQEAFEYLGITPTITPTVEPTRIPSHTPTP